LGYDYPYEGFVQNSIEKYFTDKGFQNQTIHPIDFIGFNPLTRETWIVEAKGKTSDIGLDFRTGIGQLIQRMDSEENIMELLYRN
jgi:hypothetical protein